MPPIQSVHSGSVPPKIQALMAERSLSLSALARTLGWDRARTHRRVYGWTRLSIDELHELAAALGVNVHDLLDERAA